MITARISGFTPSKTPQYVVCLFQGAKGTFQKCKWHQNECKVSQKKLRTSSKEDKKQLNFCFHLQMMVQGVNVLAYLCHSL